MRTSARIVDFLRPPQGAAAIVLVLAPLLTLLGATTACTPEPEPLVFPGWTIPPPEGTPIHEYAPVAAEDRAGHEIDLVEEQVFGAGDEPESSLYRADDVAADSAGNVYVLDEGADSVKVFDPQGHYLRTLGRPGEGPGEFKNALSMVVVGDQIVVSDSGLLRLSRWNSAGELVDDSRLTSLMEFLVLKRHTGADYLLGVHIDVVDGVQTDALSAVSLDGEELFRYTELTRPKMPRVPKIGPWAVVDLPRASPRSAAGPGGLVYVSDQREYQIVAFRGENEAAWALRVAEPGRPFMRGDVDRYLRKAREKRPETTETEIEWPERFPALETFRVDGHGLLYVFPFVAGDDRPERVPVDVYSSEGQRVFAGTIPDLRWSRAYGNHVYRVGLDPETDEYRVWRYRLVAPFWSE